MPDAEHHLKWGDALVFFRNDPQCMFGGPGLAMRGQLDGQVALGQCPEPDPAAIRISGPLNFTVSDRPWGF